jgi:hypothetical protein
VLVEAVRHHASSEAALLAVTLIAGVLSAWWLLRDFRAHPANFPTPTAAQGLHMAVTPAAAADGGEAPEVANGAARMDTRANG